MDKDYKTFKNEYTVTKNKEEFLGRLRRQFKIEADYTYHEYDVYKGTDIPFNLEREYVFELIKLERYGDAEKWLDKMTFYYRSGSEANFIEQYKYHLNSVQEANKVIENKINLAKKEFNQHTITVIGAVVGVVTIFNSSNSIKSSNFNQSIFVFLLQIIGIFVVLSIANFINKKH